MGNHAGIVSGFFTALVHAVFAPGRALLRQRWGWSLCGRVHICQRDSSGVLHRLVARSHFSAILLLLLDLLLIGLAVAWCVSIILVFQSPPPLEPDSWAITESIEQVSRIARLVASGIAILLSLWLAMRTLRLEQGSRSFAA